MGRKEGQTVLEGSVFDESHATSMLQNQFLCVNIKTVKERHSSRILQDFRNLRPRRDELKHITIILDWPGTVLGSMAHLQGVFQNSDQLFDLTIMQGVPWDATPGRESFEKVYPFVPFSIRRDLHSPFILFQGNGKCVFGKEVIRTLGEAVIDLVKNPVLLCGVQVSRELGQLFLPDSEIPR